MRRRWPRSPHRSRRRWSAPTFTPTPADVAPSPAGISATPVATAAPGEEEVYVVQAGDSLLAIAGRYGVSIEAIMDANNLTNPDFVFSGQRLVIPRAGAAPTAAPQASPADGNAGRTGRGCASPRSSATAFSGTEAVQIANDSDLAINLQGWRLEKESGPAYVFGSISLLPGSGVVLYTGSGADTSVALYWNQTALQWETGSVARLINPQGQEMSRLAAP
jgi:LysM repeat protein